MPLIPYPEHEFAPRGLTVQEVNDPLVFLEAFYDFAHLPQHRQELKEMLNITVTGQFNSLPLDRRCDLVYLYGLYEKLLEATHLIYAGHKKKKNEVGERTSN